MFSCIILNLRVIIVESKKVGGQVTEGADNSNNTEPMVNHLYRYELADNNQLINPKLLLILPATSPYS